MYKYMLDIEMGIVYILNQVDHKYHVLCLISNFKFNHKFGVFKTKSIGE